jgi:hypothetical protein
LKFGYIDIPNEKAMAKTLAFGERGMKKYENEPEKVEDYQDYQEIYQFAKQLIEKYYKNK